MDALVKHLESKGNQVSEGLKRITPVSTEAASFRYPAWELRPTGALTLGIKEYLQGDRTTWTDGKRQRLEDHVGDFVDALHRAAAFLHEERERWAKIAREREAERVRQTEIEARRREKERKVGELLDQVARWQQSEALRSFVGAARDAAVAKYGAIEEGSELDNWMKWALRQAHDIDPLRGFTKDPDD
jgi:hypothetical protein